MRRSNIPRERISNSNHMNHPLSDRIDSTFISSFSVAASFVNDVDREILFAANKASTVCEPIYENVSDFGGKTRRKSLSESIATYARLLKPKMIENRDVNESSTYQSYHRDEEAEDDFFSYAPCLEDENIYENLNFDCDQSWSTTETIDENDSVKDWLDLLSFETEDYELRDVMMTKCMPSRSKSISCCYSSELIEPLANHTMSSQPNNLHELHEFKLDILNKCFTAIWQQNSEDEILNNLYLFLNDIFATYFRKHSSNNNSNQQMGNESSAVEKHLRFREKYHTYDTSVCTSTDNNNIIKKLETFILSVTLNRLTITYTASLKFYFALESSQCQFFGVDIITLLSFCRCAIYNNRRRLKIKTRGQLRTFLGTLELIFVNRVEPQRAIKSCETENSLKANEAKGEEEENIYQPIWKWQTDCKSAITCDAIDAPIDVKESDDSEWEIDTEFSYITAQESNSLLDTDFSSATTKDQSLWMLEQSMYRTICVLYSNDNPELNRIIYSYDSSSSISEICGEKVLNITENVAVLNSSSDMIQCEDSSTNDIQDPAVVAWKALIKSPFYLEDEEDVIMSETQIAVLKYVKTDVTESYAPSSSNSPFGSQATSEYNTPTESFPPTPFGGVQTAGFKYEPTKSPKDDAPKSKIIPITNGSYGLNKSITSETSTGSSIHGSYRNINDPENIMKVDKSDAGSLEEPKSGFRNKVKTAFKLKSRAPTGSQDNVKEPDSSKDSNEDFFGPNLELVLKDSDFVTVPRIVVECLEILGKNVNIKTPGLYRVSGNKTVIETLKKKLNEKKLSKKAVLKDQDIHNISGILKMFFRELKPPLLDSNTFIQCTTDKVTVEEIKSSLKQLNKISYNTLRYLMRHLRKVEQHKDENLMNSGNLAICWGLCLFSGSFAASNQFENDISKCNVLCKKLVEQYEAIFEM